MATGVVLMLACDNRAGTLLRLGGILKVSLMTEGSFVSVDAAASLSPQFIDD